MRLIAITALILLLVFVSGCTQHGQSGISLPQLPVCGNETVEFGEQCEKNTPCPDNKICTSRCTCEQLTPPNLPE